MKTSAFFHVATTAVCLAGALMAQSNPPAPAPAPAAPPVWSAGPITFSGLIDGYYQFNNNHPANRTTDLRNFEVKANQFSLNMTKFTMEHDPDPVGFKLDIGFGKAWDLFHATDPAGVNTVKYIPQAYVSFKPKNAGGLQIDFGKFYTSAGGELTENNLTWNYGRGLLYTNGPYYHFGARINKPLNDKFAVGLQIVNGWNNVEDNNSGKTFGFTTAFTPNKKFSWYNNYYVGPEKNDTNTGKRNFFDTVVNLNPNDRTSFFVNFDYGREGKVGKGDAEWVAIAFSSRFQTTEKTALAIRYEHYNDKEGFITGQAQGLNSFTVTGEYKWLEGLLSRLEYRRDWSNKPFYGHGNEPGSFKHQDTITLGVVAFFGPKR
ncbi:MAG: porin [Acidobacteria bacterium]|nr:porin [Acidobacteriota bacterium]